jgi:hypothetical protein
MDRMLARNGKDDLSRVPDDDGRSGRVMHVTTILAAGCLLVD